MSIVAMCHVSKKHQCNFCFSYLLTESDDYSEMYERSNYTTVIFTYVFIHFICKLHTLKAVECFAVHVTFRCVLVLETYPDRKQKYIYLIIYLLYIVYECIIGVNNRLHLCVYLFVI